MNSRSTSRNSETDWARLRSMTDEDIDFSDIPEVSEDDIPEVSEDDMRGAVLRVGGKPVPKGKSFVGVFLDSDVLEYFKKQAGEDGLQRLINETLRASMAKA